MEMKVSAHRISLRKELNELDRLAIDFSALLRRGRIRHVFVAGYVSILFGRPRVSEDLDILVEPLSRSRFLRLWGSLSGRFECHATKDPAEAYDRYLSQRLALRFSRPGEAIPNVEMRWATTAVHRWALEEAVDVALNRRRLPISPIELQVAYKLYLGSDKDFDDARHLFQVFREHIDEDELHRALRRLKVSVLAAREVLGWR